MTKRVKIFAWILSIICFIGFTAIPICTTYNNMKLVPRTENDYYNFQKQVEGINEIWYSIGTRL